MKILLYKQTIAFNQALFNIFAGGFGHGNLKKKTSNIFINICENVHVFIVPVYTKKYTHHTRSFYASCRSLK